MAYTIKERLANKKKVQNMSLLEIYKKYGSRDLLKKEIIRRASSGTKELEEVRNFYKYNSPVIFITDYQKELEELAKFLKMRPEKLLDYKCFSDISYDIAKKYLSSSDYSWLQNKSIIEKVDKEFLYETLLENFVLLYKYPELLEKFSDRQIEKILVSPCVSSIKDYNKIPNFIDILKKRPSLLQFEGKIIEMLVFEKNYNLLSKIMELNILKPFEIETIIIKFQNSFEFDDFLDLMNNIPSNIIEHINQNSYFFEKIIKSYKNNQEQMEKLMSTDFVSNLNDELKENVLLSLPNNILYHICIKNNNLYYNRIKKNIDFKDFSNYYSNNAENYFNELTTSNFIFDLYKSDEMNLIPKNVKEKIYHYCLNDVDSLRFFCENFDGIMMFASEETLNLTQQKNIATIISEMLFEDQVINKVIFKFFDKYSFIKEEVVRSENFQKCFENKSESYLFDIIDRYPEILDMFNFNLITNYKSSVLMKGCDKYPNVEKLLMSNNDFLTYILSDKKNILEFMPLINKYNISNETIKLFNDNFNKIQEVRPELSWGNSSLRTEMLSEDFINILGLDYIDAILQYDSDASDIVINLYNQHKLNDLKEWLDYLNKNISKNHRMIHYYILSYSKMESLANDLIKTDAKLNDYERQILEEIIENENLYEIKSLSELDNYFKMKCVKLLKDKERLSSDEVKELFLNTSALKKGIPWELSFSLNSSELDYFKYKYVDTKFITVEEYEYIKRVLDIIENGCYDITIILDIVKQYMDKNVPTARSVINKMRKASLQEFNSKLLDLEEVRKVASYTDPNAQVYIEEKEGIEYIHLNGYDYRCLCTHIETCPATGSSTFSNSKEMRNGFEQYTILSEKIKEKNIDQSLSSLKLTNLINEDSENWNLIEGISTISSGLFSSKFNNNGFAWGKKSNISVINCSGGDAMVSHEIRCLNPNKADPEIGYKGLYTADRGEFWFDRLDENNERIQPEFISTTISSPTNNIEEKDKKAARFFNIPIIVKHSNYYDTEYENRLDSLTRKKFLETFDISVTDNILFNQKNTNNEEKVNFLIASLDYAFSTSIIDEKTYISKLIDLKWKLYENRFTNYIQKIDTIVSEIDGYDLSEYSGRSI